MGDFLSDSDQLLWVILVAVLLMVIVLVARLFVKIVSYFLSSAAYFRLARRKQMEQAFFAWIPIFCKDYIYAKIIADRLPIKGKQIKNFPILFAFFVLLYSIFSLVVGPFLHLIPYVGSFAGILLWALYMIPILFVRYHFFAMFNRERALLYMFLTLLPLVFPILALVHSSRTFTDAEGHFYPELSDD